MSDHSTNNPPLTLELLATLGTSFSKKWNPVVSKETLLRELGQNALDHFTDQDLVCETKPGRTPEEKIRWTDVRTGADLFTYVHLPNGVVLTQAKTEFLLSFFLHHSDKDLEAKPYCGGKGEGMKGVLFFFIKNGYTVTLTTASKVFTVTFEPFASPSASALEAKHLEVMTFKEYAQREGAADALVITITGPADKVPFLHSLYEPHMFLPRTATFNPATDDRLWLPEKGDKARVYCRGIFVKLSDTAFSVNFATHGGADMLNGDRNSFNRYTFEQEHTRKILEKRLRACPAFRRVVYDYLADLPHIPALFASGSASIRALLLAEMAEVHATDLATMPVGLTPWPLADESKRAALYPMLGKYPVEMSAPMAAYLSHRWNPQRELEALVKTCPQVEPPPAKKPRMAELRAMFTFASEGHTPCKVLFLDLSKLFGKTTFDDGLYDYSTNTVYIDSRVLRIVSRSKFLMAVLRVAFERAASVSIDSITQCYLQVKEPLHVLTRRVECTLEDLLQRETDKKAQKAQAASAKRKVASDASPTATPSPSKAKKQKTGTGAAAAASATTLVVHNPKPPPEAANLTRIRPTRNHPLCFQPPTRPDGCQGAPDQPTSRGPSTTAPEMPVADCHDCHTLPPMTLVAGFWVEQGNATFKLTPQLKKATKDLQWFADEVYQSTPEMQMPAFVPAAFSGDVRAFYSHATHQIFVNLTCAIGIDEATLRLLAHEVAHASCAKLRLPTPHNATFAEHMTRIALHFVPAYRRALAATDGAAGGAAAEPSPSSVPLPRVSVKDEAAVTGNDGSSLGERSPTGRASGGGSGQREVIDLTAL